MPILGKRPQAAPAAPPAPALPRFALQRALIDTRDFEAGEPWRANAGVVIARFRVPEDAAFVLGPRSRMEIYLRSKATHGGYDNSSGSSDHTLTVSTPGIVESKMKKPPFPTDRHPEVIAWADKGSGFVPVPVQGVDYNAGTVTLSVPAGENWRAVEVYYLSAQGEFRFYVVREGGGIKDWIPVHNNSFAAVHTMDQNSAEEALVLGNKAALVEGFQLALEVRTPYPVEWNDRARHYVKISALALRVPGADKDDLRRTVHLLMTGGL